MKQAVDLTNSERIANRYRPLKKLGEGGMGVVYLVHDDLTDQDLALKQVLVPKDQLQFNNSATQSDIHLALATEFRTLANLRHPHVVQVLDYGFDDNGFPYFTMDYLPNATPFTDSGKPEPLERQITLLGQVLQALEYLHRRNILHRDIKPGNVLVDANFQVKVLDFGLALEKMTSAGDENVQNEVVGTIAYMAPELLEGEPYTVQSDLYAVGIMGYELFAGQHPFSLDSISTLLIAIMSIDPDLTDIDDSTADWIAALLDKTPSNRPPSAYRALTQLYNAVDLDAPHESVEVRESFLQASRFVGREQELERFKDALDHLMDVTRLTKERHSRWLVGGESGVGKSRLIEEVRTRALVRGVRVVRGQAVEGGVPYQLWRDILRPLVISTPLTDLEAGVLRDLVPDIERLVGRKVPTADPLSGDANSERLSLTIVDVIKKQQKPLLIIIEDIQWADRSIRPLRLLLRLVDQIDTPLMLLTTYRTDEAHTLSDDLPDMEKIILKRLDREALQKLVTSMLGRDNMSDELVNTLEAETEGNVYFMVEVMRALAESAGELNKVSVAGLPERIMAGGMLAVLRRRLDSMPATYREMLRIAAVLGRQLDQAVIKAADPNVSFDDFITAGANRAIFEYVDGNWRFAHGKLRDTLLQDLTDDERTTLHRTAAQAVETIYPDDVAYDETLVSLWQVAGDTAKTVHYALIAAKQMIDFTAEYDKAAQFLERALTLAETLPDAPTHQSRLYTLRGTLHFRRANYKPAEAAYRQSLTLMDHDIETRYMLALTLSFTGTYDEAETLAQQVLDEVGTTNKLAESFARMTLGLIAENKGEYQRGLAEKTKALDAAREANDRRLEAIWLGNVAIAHARVGSLELTESFFKQALAINRELGNRLEEGRTLSNLGFASHVTGDLDGAEQYYREALEIYEAIGSDGRSYVLNNLGIVTTERGNLDRAIQYFEECVAILRTTENPVLLIEALNGQTQAFLVRGDVNSAIKNLQECLEITTEIASKRMILMTLMQVAHLRLRRGQNDRALRLIGFIETQPETDPQFAEMHLNPLKASLTTLADPEHVTQQMATGKQLSLEDVMRGLDAELTVDGASGG